MALEHALQPIMINGVEVRNRVVRSAHNTLIGGGWITDDHIAYHAARARGGVGLSILEVGLVHPTAPIGVGTRLYDDDIVPGFRRLAKALHDEGMKVFQQLWHPGHHLLNPTGAPPWSASAVPSPQLGATPVAMSETMIDEMIASFAAAARRVKEGGLDGVEVHFAHSYLIGQFLSPLTNHRTDRYGGSFDNRLRFGTGALRAVRAEVGPDFVVGVRLSASEGTPGGLTPEDTARIAQALEAAVQVDFVDVSDATYFNLDHMVAGMHEPHGYQLSDSAVVTRVVKAPTIVVGRFMTLDEADAAIAAGHTDMVSMVRATIADPDLVRKTVAGHPEQVRPCIGCNQACLGGWSGPLMRFGCAINAGAGAELRQGDHTLQPAARVKRVMVVGGGPAGLEAARVAALRGHTVSLFEARAELGGQIQLARRAPTRNELGKAVDWLEQEVRRLGVAVQLETHVDAALVARERPDAVVVATGSRPRRDGFQIARPLDRVEGLDQPHVCTSWEVLSGAAPSGKTALVLDDVGHYEAIAAAEYLLERGLAITFVTRHPTLGVELTNAQMQRPAWRRLSGHANRFTLLPRAQLTAIESNSASVRNLDSGAESRVTADVVVLVSYRVSERALAEALDRRVDELHVVGDVLSPRTLEMAVHEGHRAGARL